MRQAQSSKAPLDRPYCGSSAHHPVTHMRLPPFPAPTPARALRPAHSITALPHHSRWCDSTAFAVTQSIQQGCHSCTSWARVWSGMYSRAVLGLVRTTGHRMPHLAAALRHQYPRSCDLHACLSRFARQGKIGRRVQIVVPRANRLNFYDNFRTPDFTPFYAFLRPAQTPDALLIR